MQDAFGGIVNFMFLAIFLALAIGLLSFVVSYTRAFKMKNAIINQIESFEGAGCGKRDDFNDKSDCLDKIREEAEKLNYNQHNINCPSVKDDDMISGYKSTADGMFCYGFVRTSKSDKKVVRVVTQVEIGFPIVSNLMSMDFFQVTGDTVAFDAN